MSDHEHNGGGKLCNNLKIIKENSKETQPSSLKLNRLPTVRLNFWINSWIGRFLTRNIFRRSYREFIPRTQLLNECLDDSPM